MPHVLQKRRKELEVAAVNDGQLLTKASLDISLLPENEEDRNLASLLSLRPSRSIEETQSVVRNKILNSPALPSSSGLITSFGGLKKEESLSKTSSLTRNTLGITLKNTKSATKADVISQVDKTSESNNSSEQMDRPDSVRDKQPTLAVNSCVSLVGDYGSSGESSE